MPFNPLYNLIHDKQIDVTAYCVDQYKGKENPYCLLSLKKLQDIKEFYHEERCYYLNEHHISIYKILNEKDLRLNDTCHYTATYKNDTRKIVIHIYLDSRRQISDVNGNNYIATLSFEELNSISGESAQQKHTITLDANAYKMVSENFIQFSSPLISHIFNSWNKLKIQNQEAISKMLRSVKSANGDTERIARVKKLLPYYEWARLYTYRSPQQIAEENFIRRFNEKAEEKINKTTPGEKLTLIEKETLSASSSMNESVIDQSDFNAIITLPEMEQSIAPIKKIQDQLSIMEKIKIGDRDIIWFIKNLLLLEEKFNYISSDNEVLDTAIQTRRNIAEINKLLEERCNNIIVRNILKEDDLTVLAEANKVHLHLHSYCIHFILNALIKLEDFELFRSYIQYSSHFSIFSSSILSIQNYDLLINSTLLSNRENSYRFVKFLLAQGFYPNIQDIYGNSPLMYAVIWGDIAVAQLLLEHGANPNLQRVKKSLILNDITISEKYSGYIPDKNTPIIEAAMIRNGSMIKLLLEFSADPTLRNHRGFHALGTYLYPNAINAFIFIDIHIYNIDWKKIIVLGSLSVETAKLLIEYGCGVNDYLGIIGCQATALYFSAQERGKEELEILMALGADVTKKGGTADFIPLMIAARKGHTEIFHTLLGKGENATDLLITILLVAVMHLNEKPSAEHLEILSTLLSYNQSWQLIHRMFKMNTSDKSILLKDEAPTSEEIYQHWDDYTAVIVSQLTNNGLLSKIKISGNVVTDTDAQADTRILTISRFSTFSNSSSSSSSHVSGSHRDPIIPHK